MQAAFLMQRKGGYDMACNHERIKSVNCHIFCDICGAELPIDYLVGQSRIKEQKAAEQPAEPQETAPKEAPKAKRTTKKGAK